MLTESPSGTLTTVGKRRRRKKKVVSRAPKYSCAVLLPTKAKYLQACLRLWQGINHRAALGLLGATKKGVKESGFTGPRDNARWQYVQTSPRYVERSAGPAVAWTTWSKCGSN